MDKDGATGRCGPNRSDQAGPGGRATTRTGTGTGTAPRADVPPDDSKPTGQAGTGQTDREDDKTPAPANSER